MRRYRVYRTEQFEELWSRSIADGMVDAEAGETNLEGLARFLAVDPRYFPEFEAAGEQIDLRLGTISPDRNIPSGGLVFSRRRRPVRVLGVRGNHPSPPAIISRIRCLISP